MKAVILAGGLGTRISEETITRPKPMIEIGGRPILWHIMKIYSHYGINDFIICCGYKSYFIKEYFSNYFMHMSDITFDISENKMKVHRRNAEPWKVTLVDTGDNTMTGGRIKRVESYLKNEDTFCLTYGDGVADINIKKLINYHNKHGLDATLTAVHPPSRFGVLNIKENQLVSSFKEKPDEEAGYINGGFFVLSSNVLKLISGDDIIWEREPLEHLAKSNQLKAYLHSGYWQPVDTLREKILLEEQWETGNAPWKIWN